MIDEQVLRNIVAAAEIRPKETILEIGPGPGVLTRALLDAGARVIAIEADHRFTPLLRREFPSPALQLTIGNALTVDWVGRGLADRKFAIVSNLPYSITTPLLERMLRPPMASRVILMIQRNMAERIAAGPGQTQRGALSVILQQHYAIELIRVVPVTSFYPPPEVESAVVRLVPRKYYLSMSKANDFSDFVHNAFQHRRKLLCSNLKQSHPSTDWPAVFLRLGIDSKARPQDISNNQWGGLYDSSIDL